MRVISHSKIKNTGILFELLTRQVSADIINGNMNSLALSIIKEYFGGDSEIFKELQLYQTLIDAKSSNSVRANNLIETVLRERSKLDNRSIRKMKFNMIRKIQESYNIKEFFKNKVSNYQVYASIFKLFESVSTREVFEPTNIARSRNTIVEHLSRKTNSSKKSLVEMFEEQSEDVRYLSYKILVDKFNSKYSTALTNRQKLLIREFINDNPSNSLKSYLQKEVPTIKSELKTVSQKIDDKVIRIKITEIVNQLDGVLKFKDSPEKQVSVLMKCYSLIDTLKTI